MAREPEVSDLAPRLSAQPLSVSQIADADLRRLPGHLDESAQLADCERDRVQQYQFAGVVVISGDADRVSGAIVKICGSRSLRGCGWGVFLRAFDELAGLEAGAGADERDEVRRVDRPPA
jgi:hypothetical protein